MSEETKSVNPDALAGEAIIGFCLKCGIVREDWLFASGSTVPITDCVCSAKRKHADECTYVKSVACPISVGSCPHGRDACEECECDCKARKEGGT